MLYRVLKIKDQNSNSAFDILKTIVELEPLLADRQHVTYGVFPGLLGLASNELYWMLMSEDNADDPLPGIKQSLKISNSITLVPTVRPTEHKPRTRPGVYVFRWFSIANKDVEEIAALSKQAWTTFEPGFGVEVQGLFAEADRSAEDGTMLLITWYDSLTAWEKSRFPDPAAKDLFRRRHQLTREAKPIGTRLHLPE